MLQLAEFCFLISIRSAIRPTLEILDAGFHRIQKELILIQFSRPTRPGQNQCVRRLCRCEQR
jgi:hypothetical protein